MNILIGGKLGDFIHCMYIPNYIYRKTGRPSNIFISNIGDSFEFGLENSYKDLAPIISQQEYVNSFEIWNGQRIDINAAEFRHSGFLGKFCWTEIMTKTFFGKKADPICGSWIKYNSKKNKFENTLVISRKPKNPMSEITFNAYEKYIKKYEKTIFLGSSEKYNNFEFKHLCSNQNPQSLLDWYDYISCSTMFLGDQSAPTAMACSINAPRITELLPRPTFGDDVHYFGEIKYGAKVNFISPYGRLF